MACRIWSSFGVWANATRICVPPLKSTPSGTWCQNKMLNTPATEKIRENPRKYHFFPSQSIFVVRNSSKLTLYSSNQLSVVSFQCLHYKRSVPHLTTENGQLRTFFK